MPRLVRTVTYLYAIGLMLQGSLTLLARLVPAVDQAIPWLLMTTAMIVPHSFMHLATGLVALYAARRSVHAAWLFLIGFGAYYLALGLAGLTTHQQFGLGLQDFDHPFHIAIGSVALGTALLHWLKTRGQSEQLA